jgi:DNA-binding NarL/FixJ family response regulator
MLIALNTMEPIPLHDRILDLCGKGMRPTQIAEQVCCSRRTVHRYLEKAQKRGTTSTVSLPGVIGQRKERQTHA